MALRKCSAPRHHERPLIFVHAACSGLLAICTSASQFRSNRTTFKRPHYHRASMITRRHLIRSIGGLTALAASTAAYGVGVEPVLRLRVTRYHPAPLQW